MIAFDFIYNKPESLSDALKLYHHDKKKNLNPYYYAGGTEIIGLARKMKLHTGSVIDIKGISECQFLGSRDEQFLIGSATTLAQIVEENSYPLLASVCTHIADHTNRNKITFGGNICGQLFYREAVLPLLLTDSEMVIASKEGIEHKSVHTFNQRFNKEKGDLLVQTITDQRLVTVPYFHEKRTRQEKIDYPLVTLAAIKVDGSIRVAVSGVCRDPFRSNQMEDVLNNRSTSVEEKARQALNYVPGKVIDDYLGSADYRMFVLEQLLSDAMIALEKV